MIFRSRQSDTRPDRDRVPVQFYLNEYVDERLHRGVTTNVSPTGLYVNRLLSRRARLVTRESRFVQLEFQLPGTGETVWARGEVRHDELDLPLGEREPAAMLHGTGIRLVALPRAHARMLRDFVIEEKRRKLQEILGVIRANRHH